MRGFAAIIALVLATSVLAGACRFGGCPAALLTGDLVREGAELVAEPGTGGSGPIEHLRWPSVYRLEEDGGRLVVVDPAGNVMAGEGDSVRLGGGESGSGEWVVCGAVEVATSRP